MLNITPREIAEKLYELNCDMDCHDYDETKEENIEQLEDAIYEIKAIAENEYNKEYWKTFYKALEGLCD